MGDLSWTREELLDRLFVLRTKASEFNVYMASSDEIPRSDLATEYAKKLVFNSWVWEQLIIPDTHQPDVHLQEFILTRILWQVFSLQFGGNFDLPQAFQWFAEHVSGLELSSSAWLRMEQLEHETEQREQDIVALKADYLALLEPRTEASNELKCNVEEIISLVHKHKQTIETLNLDMKTLQADINKEWTELRAAVRNARIVEDLREEIKRMFPCAKFATQQTRKRKRV